MATVPVSALATRLHFLSCKRGGWGWTTALSVFFLQLLAALKPSCTLSSASHSAGSGTATRVQHTIVAALFSRACQ